MRNFPPLQSDFKECDDKETNNCHKDATCHDTDGSFECKCKDGYQGDGTTNCGKMNFPRHESTYDLN